MSSSVPVEVVCTAGPMPFVAQGRVREVEGSRYTIDLDQDAGQLSPGARAFVSFAEGAAARVIGRVVEARGNCLIVSQDGVRNRERRSFPRLHAGIPIRYRNLGPGAHDIEAATWARGDAGPAARGAWLSPGEFMNFSVTGLKFDAPGPVEIDDLLLIDLGVRGRTETWRCTGRVVFVEPGAEGMPSAAVEFEHIPEGAQGALSDLTLQIQEALLE